MSTELAWSAGFFDGEGCTTFHSEKQKRYPRLRIGQSGDNGNEVLERFKTAVGEGKVYGPYPIAKNQTKIRWTFQVAGNKKVSRVLYQLWPYLSSEKKQQAINVLGERYPLH